MAEILLSLTIIGVVAAITLPSLTGNINERTWNTQRKALYSRMSQAISLMPALNGYGILNDTTDTATETLVTGGLAKILKINNICNNEHLADCGIPSSFTDMLGSKTNMPTTLYEFNPHFSLVIQEDSSYSTMNTKAAAFETQNGESIVTYYNQTCSTEYLNEESASLWGNTTYGFLEPNMCINFIYDLNGIKGPNTVGKDIGAITVFNATDSNVVAPLLSSSRKITYSTGSNNWYNATKACTEDDSQSRLPNIHELSSLIINDKFFNIRTSYDDASYFWSSTSLNKDYAWAIIAYRGMRYLNNKANRGNMAVKCIMR